MDAVVKEGNGHVDNKSWELVNIENVLKDAEIIPSVWAMRRKRNLVTNKITKYKARLNIHGGKQTLGINYWETYAPMVAWFAIRLMIVCAMVLGWQFWQVDFVMTYTQAPIEYDTYMKLLASIEVKGGTAEMHVLKLLKNLYGRRQAGKVWADYLAEKLIEADFQQSTVDECVWYKGDVIFLCYVDDGI